VVVASSRSTDIFSKTLEKIIAVELRLAFIWSMGEQALKIKTAWMTRLQNIHSEILVDEFSRVSPFHK